MSHADPQRTQHLRITQDGGVREILIDRPEARNALSVAMLDALADQIVEADRNPTIRCVLLAGADEHFTAGWDLGEALEPPPIPDDGREHGYFAFLSALEALRKPLLVAVRGVAVGLGVTLLGHADLVLLAESARLRTPFAALGLCPEAGSTVTLPALIGPQRAAELFFTGRWLSATEAVAAGLGLRVVPDESVLAEARELARQVAAQPLAALMATKDLLRAAHRDAARQARRLEDLTFAALRQGPDHQRALASFAATRKGTR